MGSCSFFRMIHRLTANDDVNGSDGSSKILDDIRRSAGF